MSPTLNRRQFVASCGGTAAASLIPSIPAFGESAQISPTTLSQDPLRPQYHLLPAANWMNDPNGPIYWNGNYHVFYQYNPGAARWGDMHWAHAVSPDMIHWHHLPIALSPNPVGPDRDGCFSGSAVVHNGVPTILYTGVRSTSPEDATLRDGTHNFHESQCIATSHDPELRTWTSERRPVIPGPPVSLAVTGFRDPCVWKDGLHWYMALGSGFPKRGGCVLLYRSRDLRSWEYLHPLIVGEWNGISKTDPVDSGEMWECPDFFELDGKHVLLYSTERKVYWLIGRLDRESMIYHPESHGLLDTGAFYAPKSILDHGGKRILWGWIPETRPQAEYLKAGWAGAVALPRVLSISKDMRLSMRPLPELSALRDPATNKTIAPFFSNFSGEILASFDRSSQVSSLTIGSFDHPYLTVAYHASDPGHIEIDGEKLELADLPTDNLELHIFMDGSILEVFINMSGAHTKRVYNLDLNSPRTSVLVSGDVRYLMAWQLRPISRNRLTT